MATRWRRPWSAGPRHWPGSQETAQGRDELVAAASALHTLGARYQWARTLVMLGGPDEVEGRAELDRLRAAPMAWPPR